jgi:aryl-alcohol dehydrogenase-like predicted oxidoreductase
LIAAGSVWLLGARYSRLPPRHRTCAIIPFDSDRRRIIRSILATGAGALFARTLPAGAAPMPILTRSIPRSGEKLPVVGLGTWQEFDFRGDAEKRAQAVDTLRTFVGAGLRVIDTSPMYGAAEAVVGELLPEVDARKSAFIATKVWTTGADAGRRQIEGSFRLLRREPIDLIQVHNLRDVDVHLSTLAQLRHDGRVRYVGVTSSVASAHAELVRYVESGKIDFVQVNYSLLERDADRTVLPAALAHRVAVLINRPFGDGSLFARVRGRELPPLAAQIGATSWAQFALKWIIGHPAVTCVIPGTRNPAHLRENIAAGSGAMPDAAQRAQMAGAFENS